MYKIALSIIASATLVTSLEADTLSFEPIVVSAIKTEQTLQNTTADVQIITSDELEEKHITSVLDALRSIANIPITQNGGLGQPSSFFQRGFSSTNTVVMIDGIRYNDPSTTQGQAQLENLMVNNIDRIEIINGAQSGIWGANAAAGVINIITKQATQQLSVGANLEYGSYATTKVAADASQKIGVLSYYLGINQLKSNSFSALTPQGESPENYEHDNYKNQTVNAKLGYELTPVDTINGQFTFIDSNAHYDGYDPFTYAPLPNSEGYEAKQINRLGNVSYHHKLNAKDSIDATYAVSTFDRRYPKDDLAYNGTNKELTLQGTYHYTGDSFIVAGANTLDSKDTVIAQELDSKGLFLTNQNRWSQLILTESMRHDTYNSFDAETTGKIGMKYFLSDDLTLSSNYGTAYRAPSLDELYSPWGGNRNLEPEKTKSFDATIAYNQLSLTYYNNLVDNLIQYVYDPSTYSGMNTQVDGKSRIKGYEVHYNDTFADIFALELSYNKLFAKNQEGDYLPRRPFESALASATYYPSSKFSLGTTANYIGTRYDDNRQTNQTGRYILWSAVANYDLTQNVTLYVKGENMTDKLYQEVSGYGTAGRSVYTGLNARF